MNRLIEDYLEKNENNINNQIEKLNNNKKEDMKNLKTSKMERVMNKVKEVFTELTKAAGYTLRNV